MPEVVARLRSKVENYAVRGFSLKILSYFHVRMCRECLATIHSSTAWPALLSEFGKDPMLCSSNHADELVNAVSLLVKPVMLLRCEPQPESSGVLCLYPVWEHRHHGEATKSIAYVQ